MASGYGQYCPVAKAAEILGERWTLLIVRELIVGATRFNELQKSIAKASPTILAKRLKQLEQAGIVKRHQTSRRQYPEYTLTSAGQQLRPLIMAMGEWSARWVTNRIAKDELDAYLLMKDVQRRLLTEHLPQALAVIQIEFKEKSAHSNWWLVVDHADVDLCDVDPGLEPDFYITTSLRCMTEVWLGRLSLIDAKRSGKLKTSGLGTMERGMRDWLGFSVFADTASSARALRGL